MRAAADGFVPALAALAAMSMEENSVEADQHRAAVGGESISSGGVSGAGASSVTRDAHAGIASAIAGLAPMSLDTNSVEAVRGRVAA